MITVGWQRLRALDTGGLERSHISLASPGVFAPDHRGLNDVEHEPYFLRLWNVTTKSEHIYIYPMVAKKLINTQFILNRLKSIEWHLDEFPMSTDLR